MSCYLGATVQWGLDVGTLWLPQPEENHDRGGSGNVIDGAEIGGYGGIDSDGKCGGEGEGRDTGLGCNTYRQPRRGAGVRPLEVTKDQEGNRRRRAMEAYIGWDRDSRVAASCRNAYGNGRKVSKAARYLIVKSVEALQGPEV